MFMLTGAQFLHDMYVEGHPHRMTYSQRDVPGLTRAAIPLLSKYGVKGVTVGENGACAPVNVPNIFLWRDNATDTEVVALFHPHGYGLEAESDPAPAATVTGAAVNHAAGATGDRSSSSSSSNDFNNEDPDFDVDAEPEGFHIDKDGKATANPSDCVNVPEAGVAICYAWNGDNRGPHTMADATAIFTAVQSIYPHATLHPSDAFDDFISAVWPIRNSLPVVTQEIGDTWIQGASSDPLKVAQFRAISSVRAACVASGECNMNDADFQAFDRLLMKVGEHTWGWNGGDIRTTNYANDELAKAIATNAQFSTAIITWKEQRAFIQNAVAALSDSRPMKARIKAALAAITPAPFAAGGFEPASPLQTYQAGNVGSSAEIGFDVNTGAIVHLQTSTTASNAAAANDTAAAATTNYASKTNPLGWLWYQGMDQQYFSDFQKAYNSKPAGNFGKPGLNLSAISSNMTLVKLQRRPAAGAAGAAFLLELAIESSDAHTERGAPLKAEVLIETATTATGALQVNYTLQWYNKTRSHAPETIWLSNIPAGTSATGWKMDKLGSWIDPLEANLDGSNGQVQNGGGLYGDGGTCTPDGTTCGTHLHAVNRRGISYTAPDRAFTASSVDSALLSFGSATPVPTPLSVPDPTGGVHWALVGNIWNTNYPVRRPLWLLLLRAAACSPPTPPHPFSFP